MTTPSSLRHESFEFRRRVYAELAKRVAASLEIADRLGAISLGQMYTDEIPMGTLAKLITAESREDRLDGVPVPSVLTQLQRNLLQGMETKLAQSLALKHHPVVIPVGKQFTLENMRVDLIETSGAVECLVGDGDLVTHVYRDVGRKLYVRPARADDGSRTAVPNAPKRGPQTCLCVGVRTSVPETPSDEGPMQRVFAESQETDNSLRRHGKREWLTATSKLEPTEQHELDLRRRRGCISRRCQTRRSALSIGRERYRQPSHVHEQRAVR